MSPKDSPHSPSAMANQQYCLKWNNHQSNLLRAFDRLLQSESFTDVTLACDGKSLRAHKVVLSACSSYFEQLFEEHPDKSPIIILKDIKFAHVSQLVNFMYRGEINITQDMLPGLLKTAETLKVKGLAEVSGDQHMANPVPPIMRLAASLPQMVPPNTSPLTTALNAPLVAPPTLAPLAALLNPEAMGLDERRVNLLKRMSQDAATPTSVKYESSPKMPRMDLEDDTPSTPQTPQQTHTPIFSTPLEQTTPTSKASMPNVLTPIPHELAVNSQQELPDFLKNYSIFKLNDYLGFRTRQQFWEEPAVRRILEGIKNKEIDMKSAAELLGVSYGTLYGRYREVFGYLKHSWVNKPGRTPGSGQKERSIWEESRAQELIQKVLNKELSLTAAAVRLGVDTNTFFVHLTDNGKNKSRVALLLGTDGHTDSTVRNAVPNDDSSFTSAGEGGEDSNPPDVSGGVASEDSNMDSIAENSHYGSEVNGEKDEEPEVIEENSAEDGTNGVGDEENRGGEQSVESFQAMVEDESGAVYAEAT